jgi:1-deoxy-D-xylulose-5-phosphate reductoisomerase
MAQASIRERRVLLLGSTGSIGTQTVDVIVHLNALADAAIARGEPATRYRVVGLATGRNLAMMLEQARRLGASELALASDSTRESDVPAGFTLRQGADAAERLVREVACDVVLGAMVGSAGLPATLAAVSLGRDVALANKETLVAAGELVVPAARASGSKLLPVDSEHCAAWQALLAGPTCGVGGGGLCPPSVCGPEVSRLVLTASGGPFRTWTRDAIRAASVEQALKHPTWAMGQKVTIDSASLTNKALEVIEAHWLFGIDAPRIGVLVHPQSIVHAMVEFADGNVLAQLAPPDMRTPIQYALTFPDRPAGASRKLDWAAMSTLEFSPPDLERFPALSAAYDVLRMGGSAGAVFNAANEAAVEAFLGRAIGFGRISELSIGALKALGSSRLRSLSDATEADTEARRWVASELTRCAVVA